jgi:ABC-type lipopolysaccharide export system ATPase subunit
MGGIIDGVDITLSGTDRITGRCGGPVIGFDVDLEVADGQMTGRLGGAVVGHSVSFSMAAGLPNVVTALVAVIAYQYYLIAQRKSSSSSSSSSGSGGN